MLRHSSSRLALLFALVAAAHACNVYTEDLLRKTPSSVVPNGGAETGGSEETGGSTGGRLPTGGTGTGGIEETGGVAAAGGVAGGGGGNTGGEPTGGRVTEGGSAGVSGGGAGNETGGVPTGGVDTGGAPTGGVETGGVATGGEATGGDATGGVATGGVATGGVATGGVAPTGGVAGFTVIDMFEQNNSSIELYNGEGNWYTYHDDSTTGGVITPDTETTPLRPSALTGRTGSGIHITATNQFTEWGCGFGFDLDSPNAQTRNEYDISLHTGITFWARTASGTLDVRLKVVTADIFEDNEVGGTCTSTSPPCNDAFGNDLALTATWQEFELPFADMTQEGWGYVPTGGFDQSAVVTVQFQVAQSIAVDVWLDDVRFYK